MDGTSCILFKEKEFENFLYGIKGKINDINTSELLDYGSVIYSRTNITNVNSSKSYKILKEEVNKTEIETGNNKLFQDIKNIKEMVYNGVIKSSKDNITNDIDINIKEINLINSKYNEYINESSENLLVVANFNKNSVNNNYERRRELTEKIASCKLLANYYYMLSELYKNYFLAKCEKGDDRIRFLENYQKINRENLSKIKRVTKSIEKIIDNKVNIDVTDYKYIELWNRLKALIRGRGIYIPIIKNKEIHLLNVLYSCIEGKINKENIINDTKYFYERFKDNLVLIAEDSKLFIDNNNFRYFTEEFLDSLYNADDELLRKIIFGILYNKSKYIANSKIFKSDDRFILRLNKYNKELGLDNLYQNRKQVMSQLQCSNMITSLI
jgi:hypothetical protein